MRLLAFRKRLPCIDCKELSCVLYLFLGKTFQIYPAVCKGLCIIEFPVFHFRYLIQGHFHIWFRKLQEKIPAARRPITRISTRTAAPAYERVRSFASSFSRVFTEMVSGSPAHKQFFHPAPEACGKPGVPGQHAVGGSAAWRFPASICVFEAKKSPDMRIWRFLVSMFFTDKSNPLRIRPLPWQLLFLRGWPILQETGLCACRRL